MKMRPHDRPFFRNFGRFCDFRKIFFKNSKNRANLVEDSSVPYAETGLASDSARRPSPEN